MGQIKWYKRDPDAALATMRELSLEENGAYSTILEMWRVGGFIILDDDRVLARTLNVDIRVWKRLRCSLIDSRFLRIDDGRLTPLHTFENIVRACTPCNREKSDRTPEEMGWEL